MQRKSDGEVIWKSPPGLWGPGPFAVVKVEEDTFSDRAGRANQMGHPQPWLVEPSLGKGERLVGHRRLRITMFSLPLL